MAQLSEPTDEELLAAWQRLRRPDWGTATFDTDKAAALRWALVRLEARHPSRGRAREPIHAQAESPPHRSTHREAPAPAGAPFGRSAPARQPIFDRKRAAAGDRDDDDERCPF